MGANFLRPISVILKVSGYTEVFRREWDIDGKPTYKGPFREDPAQQHLYIELDYNPQLPGDK